jgi:hypothetical protein
MNVMFKSGTGCQYASGHSTGRWGGSHHSFQGGSCVRCNTPVEHCSIAKPHGKNYRLWVAPHHQETDFPSVWWRYHGEGGRLTIFHPPGVMPVVVGPPLTQEVPRDAITVLSLTEHAKLFHPHPALEVVKPL